jgi:Tol biopolymer transport system component
MDAALANSSPSLWTTETGLAVVANAGDQRNVLWWLDFVTGSASRIAVLPESGGTIALSSADPQGRFVLICPRRVDGVLGAITAVAVDHSESVRLLPDSLSCAGSVSSADGRYLAVTAEIGGSYSLIVVDVAGSSRVLTVPLPVSPPTGPPYLTWAGDVIVAADAAGEWPVRSLVVRLQR